MHYIFLAGIGNSNDLHWQKIWHNTNNNPSTWLKHSNWDNPHMQDWLDDYIKTIESVKEPYIVVAHSLGCLLFNEYASRYDDKNLKGSMLVAIPDAKCENFPEKAINFSSIKPPHIVKPCIIVASDNDKYAKIKVAEQAADILTAQLYKIGPIGHINDKSGLKSWQYGKNLLKTLKNI